MTRFETLLEGYTAGSLNQEELQELLAMMSVHEDILGNKISADLEEHSFDGFTDAGQRQKMFTAILEQSKEKPVRRMAAIRWMAAASVLLLMSIAAWFYFNTSEKQIAKTETQFKNDIAAPLTAKATLKLSNGTIIYLDSAGNGTLAKDQNVQIEKLAEGEIAYKTLRPAQGDIAIEYNTLTNPRGSKVINLTLSDGSKVWLNAESSLRFPAAFVGAERKVEITGEAYFEVAPLSPKGGQKMPFIVKKDETEVMVLGTHFNVNAYDDENKISVTLLEGSVKVTSAKKSQMLLAGQQAVVNNNEIALNKNANVDEVMAWKNGYFAINEVDIETIMRQVGRWYDVEVVYHGKKPAGHYKGRPSRDLSLSQMLKVVEYSGVKFKIEGRKIIVQE